MLILSFFADAFFFCVNIFLITDDEINSLLFDYKEQKFLKDEFTGKQYISPIYIQKIKKFTLVKNLVSSCLNSKTRYVNVSILK